MLKEGESSEVVTIMTGTAISVESPITGGRKEASNYFVAVLDILGFKSLLQGNGDCADKQAHYQKVYNTLDENFNALKDFFEKRGAAKGGATGNCAWVVQPTHAEDPLKAEKDPQKYWLYYGEMCKNIYFFSDTILVFIKASDSIEDKKVQLKALGDVVNDMIKMGALYPGGRNRYQIALRGGIAYGMAVMDPKRNIIFGDPIIDATILSQGQKWMGAAAHNSLNSILDSAKDLDGLVGFNAPFFRYKVPLKCEYLFGRRKMKSSSDKIKYALNWVQSHPSLPGYVKDIEDYNYPRPLKIDLIDGNVGRYDWGKKTIYKDNTLEFADSIFKEFDSSDRYLKKVPLR